MNVTTLVPKQPITSDAADTTSRRDAAATRSSIWRNFFSAFRRALLQSGRQRARDEISRHRYLFTGRDLSRESVESELARIRYFVN
jgi:hypothetical protein